MAGDWIKMRIDLQSHPKVVRILSATRTDKFRVIGGLHSVWSVFDLHSEDGRLKGYTPEALDHVIGWEGFARAMESVGWLLFDGLETLTLPEFSEHNGQSAKRRAEDQKRKRDARNSVRNVSGDDADKKRTREEKRREEDKSKSAGADLLGASKGNPEGRKSSATEIDTWLRSLDGDAIPADDPIFAYAENAGIPLDFLELSWHRFVEDMRERGKRQKDWRAHYRNAVKGNWLKLWWLQDGEYRLTTAGEQAKRARA